MMLLLVVLLLLSLAGIGGSIFAVHSDGYGPRPMRGDPFVSSRRWL